MPNVLHSTFTLGSLRLPNRIVMAPMTRCRATADHVPTALMADYYRQRATAGLIITEGTSPSPNGLGYARIPGLYAPEHVAGWRQVTNAVHTAGGRIFVQLMHTGRTSHPLNMPPGARILAPSAVGLSGSMWTDAQGLQPYPTPIAMSEEDIQQAIAEFAHTASAAVDAGFDGIELHGANGYLIDQFLNTATNLRTDRWGGSVANRIRFVVEVAKATVARIGGARVGIRISPYGVFNDMKPDAQMDELYTTLAAELSSLGLVYIHVVDHSSMGAPTISPAVKHAIRTHFKGAYMLSGGYDGAKAEADLSSGQGELVAFGRPYIANPDLVERLKNGQPMAQPDPNTFYTPGEKGYTDYPALPAST